MDLVFHIVLLRKPMPQLFPIFDLVLLGKRLPQLGPSLYAGKNLAEFGCLASILKPSYKDHH